MIFCVSETHTCINTHISIAPVEPTVEELLMVGPTSGICHKIKCSLYIITIVKLTLSFHLQDFYCNKLIFVLKVIAG